MEVTKYYELNENQNTTYQNLWDAIKEVYIEKFIALNICIRKEKWSQFNEFSFYLKKLEEKEVEQIKTIVSRREIIKIRIETN